MFYDQQIGEERERERERKRMRREGKEKSQKINKLISSSRCFTLLYLPFMPCETKGTRSRLNAVIYGVSL